VNNRWFCVCEIALGKTMSEASCSFSSCWCLGGSEKSVCLLGGHTNIDELCAFLCTRVYTFLWICDMLVGVEAEHTHYKPVHNKCKQARLQCNTPLALRRLYLTMSVVVRHTRPRILFKQQSFPIWIIWIYGLACCLASVVKYMFLLYYTREWFIFYLYPMSHVELLLKVWL